MMCIVKKKHNYIYYFYRTNLKTACHVTWCATPNIEVLLELIVAEQHWSDAHQPSPLYSTIICHASAGTISFSRLNEGLINGVVFPEFCLLYWIGQTKNTKFIIHQKGTIYVVIRLSSKTSSQNPSREIILNCLRASSHF